MHCPASGEAKLHYLSGSFEVIRPGVYVVCAMSGARIPIEDLRYWSFERQEAYATAKIAFDRFEEAKDTSGE